MDLFRWRKEEAAIMRIERSDRLSDFVREIDSDEESLRTHGVIASIVEGFLETLA